MGVFRNTQDVYGCIGKIFEEAIADPDIGPKTKEAGLTIRFDFEDPQSVIYVDFAQGSVFFGADVPDNEPAIRMSMKADDANKFWLGKLNLVMAMARGQVRAKGSVPEMLKLLPLAKPLYARYESILRGTGRNDLIEAAG
ncbi:MAG TPA: SCP2 sterol-binding domain-containing protein [Acidimicrobiia bacterium]|nr:SCP2 sterol-binding domain-containing protein [Acidimicrobiia bacterium]